MLHASMLAALRWFGVPPRGELVVVVVVLLLLTPATVLACHYKVILLRPCAPFPWPFSKQTRDAQMALLPPQPFIFILGLSNSAECPSPRPVRWSRPRHLQRRAPSGRPARASCRPVGQLTRSVGLVASFVFSTAAARVMLPPALMINGLRQAECRDTLTLPGQAGVRLASW